MRISATGQGARGKSHTITSKEIDLKEIVDFSDLGIASSGERKRIAAVVRTEHVEMRGGNYDINIWIKREEILRLAAWALEGMEAEQAFSELSRHFRDLSKLRNMQAAMRDDEANRLKILSND